MIVGNYLKSGVTLKLSLPSGLLWNYVSNGNNISVSGSNSDSGGAVNSGVAFF
ncbi:MAG: hypothetical protein SGI98_03190 [Verrucomicrobiota bacterium]|nr:hypothetical protein [Verrucomicrobiota bacterium]